MTISRERRSMSDGLTALPPADRLLATFTYARVDELLGVVNEALPMSEEQTNELRIYARRKVRTVRALATALVSPEDVEELYRFLASLWLELHLEWERHNAVANFGLVATGEVDSAILTAAGTISGMIGWLEELLSPSDIELLKEKALGLVDGIRLTVGVGFLRTAQPENS